MWSCGAKTIHTVSPSLITVCTVESKQSIEFQSENTHEQFELFFCPVVQFLQSMVGGGTVQCTCNILKPLNVIFI